MNLLLRPAVAAGVLFLAAPIAALADVSQIVKLNPNTALNLDTGTTAPVGGGKTSAASQSPDILWNGVTITPQGSAKVQNIGTNIADRFGDLPESYFNAFKSGASSAAIPAVKMVVDDVFVVFTNQGHTSKVLITGISSGVITLQFFTYGAAPVGPVITAIENNSSRVPAGSLNYGIAPSSIFVITGSGLADPGQPVLQSSAGAGLPTTLNGASITVTVNGVTTHPPLYYTSPTQIAAVLPAATPVGDGNLTVTYNGATSLPATIHVTPHALGINLYQDAAVATDAITGSLITFNNSATPGEILVLWTTGLGADPGDSDITFSTTPHAVNTPLRIYIGGVEAAIQYQGSAGYPGVNQINFTVPSSVPTGCFVSLAAVVGTAVDHSTVIPIAPAGGPCSDPVTGMTGSQVAPQGGLTIRGGFVTVLHTNTATARSGRSIASSADAAFEKYSGVYPHTNSLEPGGCILNDYTAGPIPAITGLDSGKITLQGPGGLNTTMGSQFGIKGAFYSDLSSTPVPATGGTYTFQGSGGADVGPFSATVTIAGPLLTVTSPGDNAQIVRSQDLNVAWTGGNPGTYVYISGATEVRVNGTLVRGGFTCLAKADAGRFAVPSYILSSIPAGPGALLVENVFFTPLSISGLDLASAGGSVSYSVSATYQ